MLQLLHLHVIANGQQERLQGFPNILNRAGLDSTRRYREKFHTESALRFRHREEQIVETAMPLTRGDYG
jgi:hypothetical protein